MPPVETLMTDEDLGMKILTDMRALSLNKFCLLGVQFLTSLSTAAEGLQKTTAQVMPGDINKASAGAIAAVLTGIEPANAKGIVAFRAMFGSFCALEELLAISDNGAETLEKVIGRIPITDYWM